MAKICYLLGAGASKNALPLAGGMRDGMKSVLELLKLPQYELSDEDEFLNIKTGISKRQWQNKLIEGMEWLWSSIENFASVDTFAKYLSLMDKENELENLKILLTIYLIIGQAIKPPDNRYDSFFASILESQSTIPDDLLILTWNYDYQIEITQSRYYGNNGFGYLYDRMGINVKNFRVNKVGNVYKINGVAQFYGRGGFRNTLYPGTKHDGVNENFINQVVEQYAIAKIARDSYQPLISFAWEEADPLFWDILKEKVREVEVLVVIGYSFPFFNRKVDRLLINGMPYLYKIYFQAPNPENLADRCKSIKENWGDSLRADIKDVDQFYLPYEL